MKIKEKRNGMNQRVLQTDSGIRISIRYPIKVSSEAVIIIAPGFFQSKETKTFKELEKDLIKSIDIISMDFRGHGKSGGVYTFSAKEKKDLKTVIDFAKKKYKKIGVLGFSYGGTIAILEQESFKNIDSLICVGTPMSSDDIEFCWWRLESIRLGLKGCEWGAGVRPGYPFFKKERPIDLVSHIHPSAILFIHGDSDPIVDVRHSRLLFEKAMEPKRIIVIKGGSHAEEIYRKIPEKFIEIVLLWFSETLNLSKYEKENKSME